MVALFVSTFVALDLAAALAAAVEPVVDPGAAVARRNLDEHLAAMQVTLDTRKPPRFVLRYAGPRAAFSGELCYWFDGYNETCLRPELGWLTRATRIELPAPGGVPVELLGGYTLFVRVPELSERTFRFSAALIVDQPHPG